MRRPHFGHLSMRSATAAFCVLVLLSLNGHASPAGAAESDQTVLHEMHRGKAGLYLRLGNEVKDLELLRTHLLLDAVVLGVRWPDVEPKRGTYAFETLRREVEAWGKAGKGVVLLPMLYGQAVDDAKTPRWLFEQADVQAIAFAGGGTSKGAKIRIPAVWKDGFIGSYVDPLVAALAKEFDGHSAVWYIMPGFGSSGNLNAQPSKGGSEALPAAGWTADKWMDYCRKTLSVYQKHFRKTPLLLKSGGKFLRDRKQNNYEKDAVQLLVEFGKQGTSLIHFDLKPDQEAMKKICAHLADIVPAAQKGRLRIGLGDDWPLWVPADRRQAGPTEGHDEKYLRRVLEYAFGGVQDLPAIPTTILFCQLPEILASHPKSTNKKGAHEPDVADIRKQARERLQKNDQAIFAEKKAPAQPDKQPATNPTDQKSPADAAKTDPAQARQRPAKSDVPTGVELVTDIAYREGNAAWKLDLAAPKEKGAAPRPAIVFIHGGGWRSGDKGGATRFPALTIGYDGGIHGGTMMCWTRSGARVPPIAGPRELFRKLFISDSASDRAAADDRFRLKGSILDAVQGDAKALERRLGKRDQEKLAEYFSSVRDVERQLELGKQWSNVPKPKPGIEEPANAGFLSDLPVLYDLMALALQTDSTRIATLETGSTGFGFQAAYHGLSHHGQVQERIDPLVKIERYQTEQFARFLGKLKAVEDGAKTLLDNTMVLFGSGMGNAALHVNTNLPILLAGGGFKHGDFKSYPQSGRGRTQLCNLYLSMLQRFGVKTERFGLSTGTLSGLELA